VTSRRARWRVGLLPAVILLCAQPLACGPAPGRPQTASHRCRAGRCAVPHVAYGLGPGTTDVTLLVEPNDGLDPIVRLIDGASHRIFISAYLLTQTRIVHALERAAVQGVKVFAILEPHPFGVPSQPQIMFATLHAAGILVKWAPSRFTYAHAKFLVLDDTTAVISSANFTEAGFSSDRDFVVIDRAETDVHDIDNLFRRDWDRKPDAFSDRNLIVSPDNARRDLLGFIASARRTLDVYTEELLDAQAVHALEQAAERGVWVRVITATVRGQAKEALTADGVDVHTRTRSGNYAHAKAIVVDGRAAFIGSENFSETSLDENRELGVKISSRQVVRRLSRTFDRDFGAR
jgi:cardiolipin synthase